MTNCGQRCRKRSRASVGVPMLGIVKPQIGDSLVNLDRAALLGLTIGAVLMFAFGVIWLLIGLLSGRPSRGWLRISLLFAGIALGAAIAIMGVRASGLMASAVPLTPKQLAINREIGRHFYLIFGFEMAAIFVAVVVLKALNFADYILSGVALIVGVHFFPVAALFHWPAYYGTALAGCAIGLLGFFVDDPELRQKIVGISFGLLLWVTATFITWIGMSALLAMPTPLST